ncbi:platelet-activating factor acetylhydrolase, isoform II-domain-containing protein [Pterulicium gracile]|uniref:1-alkyl-2-acetylglycerophosphocholine esterase n=1 Tax=Pterulicium gracile TaxID=1884261 RepID=A0A5C3QGW4_9AGAR|nr:platelet-activating factor acetylhydrolase, isoform II-domain-containing protein [Pterula gracilis]
MDWLMRPLRGSLNGYAQFLGFSKLLLWPFIYMYGAFVKVPVMQNAPLLPPAKGLESWPLVIFSHGLCGGRTAYSQYCSTLAASGRVILAIEHGDGTAPLSAKWLLEGNKMKISSEQLYLKEQEIDWETPEEVSKFQLRQDQLLFRRHEVYMVHSAFSSFVNGTVNLESIDGEKIPLDSWRTPDSSSSPSVNCTSNIALTGHSFGGATLLSLLSTHPPSEEYSALPISKMICLDPWLEPLASEDPTPVNNESTSPVSSLVINSEGFTLWDSHFERLQRILRGWNTTELLTLVRSQHIHFSDFKVLPLVRTAEATALQTMICNLSIAFLESQTGDPPPSQRTPDIHTRGMQIVHTGKTADYGDGKRTSKRRLDGVLGDVVVH